MIIRELKNKWIVLLLAISALISIFIIEFVWNDTPEFWKHGEEFGDVLFNLSIGYIGAFIFYILDIWIPEVKEKKRVNQRIKLPLSRLLKHIEIPIEEIIKKYGNESLPFENIPKDDFIAMVEKMDLKNHEGWVHFLSNDKMQAFNCGECLVKHKNGVNEHIDHITLLPINLDFDLIEILDEIKHSTYHEEITSMARANVFTDFDLNIEVKGDAIAKFLYEYYQMCLDLKEYMKNNQIPIVSRTIRIFKGNPQ